MRIGVVAETQPGETRVAATPKTVEQLRGLGYEVVIESGAGLASSFADDAYTGAGATIGTREQAWQADVVFKVNAPSEQEIGQLAEGATLVGLLSRWQRGRSPHWPWTPCRGSRGRSRWTCSARWPISPATARWWRPRTCSAASSPDR
jgi:hypothetical protein